MTDRPLVTVITPTFNQAAFIERTLASIRAQSYPEIEHIVIDAGSTDGTLDILRREAAAGRLSFVSEPDRGMYDGINKGQARARGEILAYLNSDDCWFPWSVEAAVETFQAHPDAELAFGDGIKVTEENGFQRLRLFAPFDRISLANYESLCQPAVFWRRRLYERMGGFDAEMRYAADLDYWLRAAAAGAAIVHIPEVIAIERMHAAAFTAAHHDAIVVEIEAMRARHTGDQGGFENVRRASARVVRWQRWLWLRFMIAFAFRPVGRPWRRFIEHGGLAVRGKQIASGVRRFTDERMRNAVKSRLAYEIVGVDPGALPRPRRGRILLQRVTLAARALPFLLPMWLNVRLHERR